jgi:hypothetical protein
MEKSTAQGPENPLATLVIIRLVSNVEFRYIFHKIRTMDFTSKPVEQTKFSYPISLRSLLILSASLSLGSPSCFVIKRIYALISLAHAIFPTHIILLD